MRSYYLSCTALITILKYHDRIFVYFFSICFLPQENTDSWRAQTLSALFATVSRIWNRAWCRCDTTLLWDSAPSTGLTAATRPLPLLCSSVPRQQVPLMRSSPLSTRSSFAGPTPSQASRSTSHTASEASPSCLSCKRRHSADLTAAAHLYHLLAVHQVLCSLLYTRDFV